MLSQPMKALFLLNVEPELDAANAAAARAALGGSGLVVALTPFRNAAADVADVLLPISPFTETAGTFVNAEGRVQSFQGVARRSARPARPGRCCACSATCWACRASASSRPTRCWPRRWATSTTLAARLSNDAALPASLPTDGRRPGFERIADVPIYSTDSLVRRALSLQLTADARAPQASLPEQAVGRPRPRRPATRCA